jgi:hypothetical protein
LSDKSLAVEIDKAKNWSKGLEAVISLSDQLEAIENDLETADRKPTEIQTLSVKKLMSSIAELSTSWGNHLSQDLPSLNAGLQRAGIKPVTAPDGSLEPLNLPDGGEDLP